MSLIYHIADSNHWEQAQLHGYYVHPSVHSEGFIHASTEGQLEKTANLYYSSNEDILVLYIDTDKLNSPLQYETSEKRGEDFPHIHGPVNIESVTKTKKFKRRADGRFKIKL